MAIAFGMRIRPSSRLTIRIEAVDGDFDKVTALPDGERYGVDPANLPKQLKWLSRDCSPPDDFDHTPWMNVSARAKDAIEEIEPGMHQFVPVEYLDKDGRHLEHRYWCITGQVIDSVDREQTTMVFVLNSWMPAKDLAQDFPEMLPPGTNLEADPKLIFNLVRIGRAHMWRDRYAGAGGAGSPPFISQTMHDHLQASGLTGIVYGTGEVEAV